MEQTATAKWETVDSRLWLGLLLGPLAAGINTVVGYTVSHYACATREKFTLFLVMVVDLILCGLGAYLAHATRPMLEAAGDAPVKHDRRVFMLQMAISLSLFCAVVVVAGTLAVLILQPCD